MGLSQVTSKNNLWNHALFPKICSFWFQIVANFVFPQKWRAYGPISLSKKSTGYSSALREILLASCIHQNTVVNDCSSNCIIHYLFWIIHLRLLIRQQLLPIFTSFHYISLNFFLPKISFDKKSPDCDCYNFMLITSICSSLTVQKSF